MSAGQVHKHFPATIASGQRHSGKRVALLFMMVLVVVAIAVALSWRHGSQQLGGLIYEQPIDATQAATSDFLRVRQGAKYITFGRESPTGVAWSVSLFGLQKPADLLVIDNVVRVRALDPYGVPESSAYDLQSGDFLWRAKGPQPPAPESASVNPSRRSHHEQALARGWSKKSWRGPSAIARQGVLLEIYGGKLPAILAIDLKTGALLSSGYFPNKVLDNVTVSDDIEMTFDDNSMSIVKPSRQIQPTNQN